MTLRSGIVLVFLLSLAGCDGEVGVDAGSGTDAGRDAATSDGGVGLDAGPPGDDAGTDAGAMEDDAGGLDAGLDASIDAGVDVDAGVDAGTDAGVDAGTDAAVDAGGTDAGGTDAGGMDAGMDAGFDAGMDAGFDAGRDAGFDGGFDAGRDAGTDAGPPEPAHCLATDLILERVEPGVGITIFNPTSATIATANYWFCQQPSYARLGLIAPGISIAPGARHVFPWPSTFPDNDDGGEVALYRTGSSFASSAAQIDFVCWGTGHTPSRKSVAQADGDWVGDDCAGAITGTALRRRPNTDGRSEASYDSTGTAAALSCP